MHQILCFHRIAAMKQFPLFTEENAGFPNPQGDGSGKAAVWTASAIITVSVSFPNIHHVRRSEDEYDSLVCIRETRHLNVSRSLGR